MRFILRRVLSVILSVSLAASSASATGYFHNAAPSHLSYSNPTDQFESEALTLRPAFYWGKLNRWTSVAALQEISKARETPATTEDGYPNPLYVAEHMDLNTAEGPLKSPDQLMQDFIKQIIPQKSKKSNDEAIQQAVFYHINGLVLIPLLYQLSTHFSPVTGRSLLREIDRRPGITLQELAHAFNPGRTSENLGWKYKYLQVIALKGWLEMAGKDADTRYFLTPLGRKVLEIAEKNRKVLAVVAHAFERLSGYYRYFRKPTLNFSEGAALQDYHNLISLSGIRWIVGPPEGDALAGQATQELRNEMDGVLVSPTLIALGIPDYQKDGNLLKEAHPAFFREGSPSIELPKIKDPFNIEFLESALGLLDTIHPFEKRLGYWNRQKQTFTFTDDGMDFMRRRGSYGVPGSYILSYSPDKVKKMLFDPDQTDPAGIADYQHFDPVVNGWGTALTHTTFMPDLLKQVLPLQGARAAAELGAGSGRIDVTVAAAEVGWLKIIRRYEAAQNPAAFQPLNGHRFAAICADITETAIQRSLDRLTRLFAGRPDIDFYSMFGDVTRPAEFAQSVLLETGLAMKDVVLLLMFVIEERDFRRLNEHDAERILRESIEETVRNPEGRLALAAILREMLVLGPDAALPEGEALYKLVDDQLDIAMSDRGRLVPARVAAADLIVFMKELKAISPLAIMAYDVCTTWIRHLTWRKGVQPDVNYLGTHLLREKIYPELVRRMLYVLSGFRVIAPKPFPSRGAGPGGRSAPLVGFSVLEPRPAWQVAPMDIPAALFRVLPHQALALNAA
jgi:hypothetical protein